MGTSDAQAQLKALALAPALPKGPGPGTGTSVLPRSQPCTQLGETPPPGADAARRQAQSLRQANQRLLVPSRDRPALTWLDKGVKALARPLGFFSGVCAGPAPPGASSGLLLLLRRAAPTNDHPRMRAAARIQLGAAIMLPRGGAGRARPLTPRVARAESHRVPGGAG